MAKVYVSSTVVDLVAERRAVMEWLVAAGHQPVHSYRPNSETVRESCLDDIDGCDLYVLILSHRYGFQPDEDNSENLSITHLEFRRAGQSKIPRIALIRTGVPDVRQSDLLDPQRAALVGCFEQEVRREVRPAEFSDLQGLIQGLSTGVQSELEKLLAPTEHHQDEVWLEAHLRDVAKQFADHMTLSAVRSGTQPEELYLDLVVAERHLDESEAVNRESGAPAREGFPLEDVLERARTPLLLIGEGGAGKTASLLHIAARAADRARGDRTAPVPIYANLARLTRLDDVPDLLQLIADSVPLVEGWSELSDLGIAERRQILFLFDSFNELPEHLQSNSAVVLRRFVEKQRGRHAFLIGSRLVPHLEQLARGWPQLTIVEILRLSPEQVRGYLQGLGLGSLFERMPGELRELAGNPFMLLAIARSLAATPDKALPRNRGELYRSFVRGWMENEEKKRNRSLQYSYERVKEPLLEYLATRMTAAGQTSLASVEALDEEVERQLEGIYQRIKRRGGMPADWTVDRCRDEILADSLLRRADEQLYFMHQSVQEYFTGLYFSHTSPDALVEFTPKLSWELLRTTALAEVPNHRFVPALGMMSGLLDDSTQVVDALAARNPLLGAATVSSASKVDNSLLARLERSWLEFLEHNDLRRRVVGCSCLVLASMRSPRVVQRLIEFALSKDFNDSQLGILSLDGLGAPEAIALELAERVRNFSSDEYKEARQTMGNIIKRIRNKGLIRILFDNWRTSTPDSSLRHRFEELLASVGGPLLYEELRSIRADASDPAIAANADLAIAEAASWENVTGMFSARVLRELFARAQIEFSDRVAEAVNKMRSMDAVGLAAHLRSSDPTMRAAAARLAAERKLPIDDIIIESLLRINQGMSENELISSLVSLRGEHAAATRLAEAARGERNYRVGNLNPELASQLEPGELPDAVKLEVERLGVSSRDLMLVGMEADGTGSHWVLLPSSWGKYQPRYELRGTPGRLELLDCNVAYRALAALAKIPAEASLVALQRAIQLDEPDLQCIAIRALTERGDPGLAGRLLTQLRSATSSVFVFAALDALAVLQDRQALSLINDLLTTTDGKWSDVHPIWGPSPRSPGWGDALHRVLLNVDAENEIQQALDRALASEDSVPRVAALKEISRWFAERDLVPERSATWRTSERLHRLLDLTLRDATESVRNAAADALRKLESEAVQVPLADALADKDVELQLAAGEATVRIEAVELYKPVAEKMLQIAKGDRALELRRRAGKVLDAIPGGLAPFYQPIRDELLRGGSKRVLELIEATLEVLPEDANLFWWRGHALRDIGRLDQAADSFQRAFELEQQASIIPQELARTFIELGDYPRALEIARRGVEISPNDANAQSMLAWCSYKAGAIPEAVEAASKAVDLDPVHGDAVWVVLLGHICQANLEEARSAFRHAMRVRQVLSPGLDTSFATTFVKELGTIRTDELELSRLAAEIKDAFPTEDATAPK